MSSFLKHSKSKQMKQFILAALALSTLASCTSTDSKDSPENTVKTFLTHVGNKDYKEAKKVASANTRAYIDFQINLTNMLDSMGRPSSESQSKIAKLETGKDAITCTEDGRKATCKVCETESTACETLNLVTENGRWKVDLKKESDVPQK
jgi:hypothetical protein